MYILRKRKTLPILGIDISATTVKLIELTRSGSRFRVESYAVEPLPGNAVVDKAIADVGAVSEVVQRVVKRSRTRNTSAAVAVSGSSVITKIIHMDAALSEPELEDQLEAEADQHIPFPVDEVAMDFEVLGESPDDPEYVDVVLAASRTGVVDSCVEVLSTAGLTAKVVDVESFAVNNVVALMVESGLVGPAQDDEEKVVAVADIGSTLFTFSVIEDLTTVYSRAQSFGGAQLTGEIQRRYNLSYEEAGAAKKKGNLPADYETEVLVPFKEEIARQIERAQQFFFSSSATSRIDHLMLAGGCASIAGVARLVEDALNIPTTVANPFTGMATSSRVNSKNLLKDAPSLLVATGLSLRGVAA